MKKFIYAENFISFFTIVIFLFFAEASSQNNINLKTSDASIGFDKAFSLTASLENSDNVSAIQFDITYDNSSIEYKENFITFDNVNDFEIGVNKVQPGLLRVILYSTSNEVLATNTGDFISLDFKAVYQSGDFQFDVTNVVLSDSSGENLDVTTESGNISVIGPEFSLSSTSLDFGDVPMRSNQSRYINISNQGNAELILNDINIEKPFTITDSTPFTVGAGTSRNLRVDVDTSVKLNAKETVNFVTNDPSAVRALQTTEVSANVFAVNEIYIGAGSGKISTPITIPVSIENMEPFNGYQFDVTLPENFTYVDGSISLSGREVDHEVSASIADGNTLRILSFSPSNTDYNGSEGEVLSFQLNADVNSGTFPLTISESVISNTDLGNIISDSYQGSIQIDSPYLRLSKSSFDLGRVPVNETREMDVELTNTGQSDLLIDKALYDFDELSTDITPPLELDPYESVKHTITFNPGEPGEFNGDFSLRHNASNGQNLVNVTASVFSPNYLRLEDTYATPGSSFKVPIVLSSLEDIRGIQFDIQLSEGFTLINDGFELDESLSDFSITSSDLGNNSHRVIIYTTGNASINAGTTSILDIALKADQNIALGQYGFSITNVVISNLSNQDVASESLEQGYVFLVNSTAPVATGQEVTTDEDTALDITLSATDVDGDALTYVIDQQPVNGTINLAGDTVIYTPDDNFNGSNSLTFYANDGTEDSNTATVSITVNPVNDAPVSTDQEVTTDENTTLDITLSATDVDGDDLTYVIDQQPTNGSIALTDDVATYTPNDNFNGSDSFTFYANDGTKNSNTATIYIEVESTLGIEDYQNNDIKIYPNPFSLSLTVEFQEAEELLVFDLQGKLLRKYDEPDNVSHLQLNTLPEGVYILSIRKNKQLINKKIIKKNR